MSDILTSLRQPLSILLFCGLAGTGSMLVMASSDLTTLPVVKVQETTPSQQPPAQQPAKPRKKVFTNEDFGAPPAEEAKEQMYKKASAERAGEEEAWRAEVQAAREALKAAQEQKNAPKEVTPEAIAEPKSNIDPDIQKIEELSKPKSDQTATTTTPSEPETDPVAEAERRLERLLAQGQDKGFRETPPPPPQPKIVEIKKEEPKKDEKKKDEKKKEAEPEETRPVNQ
ncbi:MAG TPA: hypothetical protein PLU80_03075 [Acidobacteriota bacterium]|nr:hypothetical protein [Acidobacteriota bacterium]